MEEQLGNKNNNKRKKKNNNTDKSISTLIKNKWKISLKIYISFLWKAMFYFLWYFLSLMNFVLQKYYPVKYSLLFLFTIFCVIIILRN